MPRFLLILLLAGSAIAARAEVPPLLAGAVERWLGEPDNWAFTMQVREFAGGAVKEERLERYDPSFPAAGRWQLLTVDGRPPTDERRAEWQKRKTKKRKNPGKPLHDYLDLEHATVLRETEQTVCFRVPLQNNNRWLLPVDQVELSATVNKTTHALEEISARLDEPFRIALGLARVLDVDLDLQMSPDEPREQPGDPANARPAGTAKVVMNKLGERVEYAWSAFQRVTPHPDNRISEVPARPAG